MALKGAETERNSSFIEKNLVSFIESLIAVTDQDLNFPLSPKQTGYPSFSGLSYLPFGK